MPPRNIDVLPTNPVEDEIADEIEPVITEDTHPQKRPPMQIVWRNIVYMSLLHLGAIYGMFLLPWAQPLTWLWSKLYCLSYCINIYIIESMFV